MKLNRKKGKSIVGRKTKKDYSFKGIEYKSSLEKNMAMLLDEAGIKFKYESEDFEVLPSFRFPFMCFERQSNGKGEMINRGECKVRGISYKPDFVGDGFIIETKGYANESFPMRWKLFKKHISESGIAPEDLMIFKPQNVAECKKVIDLIKEFRDAKGRRH